MSSQHQENFKFINFKPHINSIFSLLLLLLLRLLRHFILKHCRNLIHCLAFCLDQLPDFLCILLQKIYFPITKTHGLLSWSLNIIPSSVVNNHLLIIRKRPLNIERSCYRYQQFSCFLIINLRLENYSFQLFLPWLWEEPYYLHIWILPVGITRSYYCKILFPF